MKKEVLNAFEQTGFGNTQVERLTLEAGEAMPLQGYPEERLYLVQSGFGAMSVYDDLEKGDLYILRPCVTLFYTPGLRHMLVNTGADPLVLILFRMTGGRLPAGTQEGIQNWTGKEAGENVGCGFWYTDIFNTRENETVREGLYLEIWGVTPRRPQKFSFGEVLRLNPGGSTRPHTHGDEDETFYLICGEGSFLQDGKESPIRAGQVISCPAGMVRSVKNTGKTPLLYLCVATKK